ncbi:hypothetical protein J3L18_23130 [Mucilaginibacter gossypii]|uniref:hypothetical protein n=1 Tax=Mucilaginibacter gossypii TaxID=551996 RepID=UPI000DCAFFAF|nr:MULTISPECIES: hypothetical protein [Mucilaginibacter]QTE36009.1 hypothetical protein J3L18_23130 [Mucilaginibacter gossypii]RAV56683.1 hypothetical protein DIU36_14880 [Mucilaginibacter rubeus]
MVIGFKKQFEAPIKAGTKIHTIREDAHNRWKPGMMMHQATGVRTKYYRCFNETPCISTQQLIMFMEKDDEGGLSVLVMKIGQRILTEAEQEQLAINDGFPSLYEFKKWWYPELAKQPDYFMFRKIIHWTNFRY